MADVGGAVRVARQFGSLGPATSAPPRQQQQQHPLSGPGSDSAGGSGGVAPASGTSTTTATTHLTHVSDPPRFSVLVQVDGIDVHVDEAQFAHLRALLQYVQTYGSYSRYRQYRRPPRRHEALLSPEQARTLRSMLLQRRAVAATALLRGGGVGGGVAGASGAAAAGAAVAASSSVYSLLPLSALSSAGAAPTAGGSISGVSGGGGSRFVVPDPLLQVNELTRVAIRVRARGWWRWAVDCVRHDMHRAASRLSSPSSLSSSSEAGGGLSGSGGGGGRGARRSSCPRTGARGVCSAVAIRVLAAWGWWRCPSHSPIRASQLQRDFRDGLASAIARTLHIPLCPNH